MMQHHVVTLVSCKTRLVQYFKMKSIILHAVKGIINKIKIKRIMRNKKGNVWSPWKQFFYFKR